MEIDEMKQKALWEASGELSQLANETVQKIIDIGTKMLIKNQLLRETSIPSLIRIYKAFVDAHNRTAVKIIDDQTMNALQQSASIDPEKVKWDPKFRKFCEDYGFPLEELSK